MGLDGSGFAHRHMYVKVRVGALHRGTGKTETKRKYEHAGFV